MRSLPIYNRDYYGKIQLGYVKQLCGRCPKFSKLVCMMGCACNDASLECSDFYSSTGAGAVTPRAWYPFVFGGAYEYNVFEHASPAYNYKLTASGGTGYVYDSGWRTHR
jgi:hypothetical protein